MQRRNVVNREAIGPAVRRLLVEHGLDTLPVAATLAATFERAVERQSDGWQGVRKRRAIDPEWVAVRLAEGVRLHRFKEIAFEIEAVACGLADDLKRVLALADGAEPDLPSASARAKRCRDRLDRLPLPSLARDAEQIARAAQSERFALRFREAVAPKGRIEATQGRFWQRVRSLNRVDAIGRRYGNCLSRSGGDQYRLYWQRMLDGELEFWALFESGRTASVGVATVDVESETLDEVEGVRTRELSPRYRDDVAAFMRGRALDPDWTVPALDMGLVPEMLASPVAPSGEGKRKGVPWRVFRFERSFVVERGGEDPACAVLRLPRTGWPKRLYEMQGGGELSARPLARILDRYARKQPVIDPVLGRILALALRELC